MSRQGFILQASMRLMAGQPVLLFLWTARGRRDFLVRDDRQRACFVRTCDGEAVQSWLGRPSAAQDAAAIARKRAGVTGRATDAGVGSSAVASAPRGGHRDV